MLDKNTIRHIHCIGIGGIGVGGIAEYLLHQGYQVTGSDSNKNKVTEKLEALGATIYQGHLAEQVGDADVVVYSSAVKPGNPEYDEAKKRGMHLLRRAEMLAELMADSRTIAISGTHGKTTTTSLVAAILLAAELDPSFMIGGHVKHFPGPAHLGEGEYFVAEADESDASFLHFHPEIAIVNNIEADHMETYHGDFNVLKKTFETFLNRIPSKGLAVLNADDKNVMALQALAPCATQTFGFSAGADFQITQFEQSGVHASFIVKRQNKPDLPVHLQLPGEHNAMNTAAAIVVANHVGVSDEIIRKALAEFQGVGRRFHILGDMPVKKGNALVIDDYGHHPSAITATLKAAKRAYPDRRVVLVYQPHRYTRTHDLMDEFVAALSEAEQLLLLDVFAAGEKPIVSADSKTLCDKVALHANKAPVYVGKLDALAAVLKKIVEPNDVVIFQGAGDIGAMPGKFVK